MTTVVSPGVSSGASHGASTAEPILKVDHLSMKFGGLVAIGDLSFEARRGEITALIGPNGAGKTTVFNCITGFYKPSEGMITLRRANGTGYLLERLADYQITKTAKVARTFQNIRLFSGMTVLENLLVAQHNVLMKASGYTFLGLFGFSSYRDAAKQSMEKAKFWLEKAELTSRADDPAGDLPYGAQRRLEIARAMCTDPELLCLDEPAAGLNPKESLALNELLLSIKQDTGTSILLIEHDMSVVMQISDHVVVLEYGRKISDGDPTHVKSDPKVIAAYLGVDDEEVSTVLTEVGDEGVIEELDGEPGPAQSPNVTSSFMAGPISETVRHSDAGGEVVKVSPGASKANRVSSASSASASASATSTGAGASTGSAPRTASSAGAASGSNTTGAKASATSGPAAAAPKAKTASAPAAKSPAPKTSATPKASAPPKAPGKTGAASAASSVGAKTSKATPGSSMPVTASRGGGAGGSAKTPPVSAKPAPSTAPKAATPKAAAQPASSTSAAKAGAGSSQRAPAKPAAAKPDAVKPVAAKTAGKPSKKAAASKGAPAKGQPATGGLSNALAAPRGGKADQLILIKGIGPVNERKLNEHGIFHFDQIAAWKRADIKTAEAYLAFDGRIDREDWIGQAKVLGKAKPAPDAKPTKRGGRG